MPETVASFGDSEGSVQRAQGGVLVAGVVVVALASRVAVGSVPPLLGHLRLGSVAQSLLATVPLLCYAVGALAGPRLQIRFGEEQAIFTCTAFLLVGLLVRAAWPDSALFPGTIVAGFAVAGLNVLLPSLVKARFGMRAADMTGIYTMLMVISTAAAAGLTVPVYHWSHSLTAAFGVWCIPTAVALVMWIPQLRQRSRPSPAPGPRKATAIWSDPLARNLAAFIAAQWLLFYAPFSWLPEIYRARGLSDSEGGLLLTVLNLTAIPTTLAVSAIAGRMRDQRIAVTVVVLTTATGFLGILVAPASTALIWVTIFGLAQGAALGLGMLLVILRASTNAVAAELSSMTLSVGFLCAAGGIMVMGLLHQFTGAWTVPLVFVIIISFTSWPPGLAAARNQTVAM